MDAFSSRQVTRSKVAKSRRSDAAGRARKEPSKLEQRLVKRMTSEEAAAAHPAHDLEHRYAGRRDKIAKPTSKAARRANSSARRAKYGV